MTVAHQSSVALVPTWWPEVTHKCTQA